MQLRKRHDRIPSHFLLGLPFSLFFPRKDQNTTKMCGRYALMAKQEELARRFLLNKMSEELLKALRPRFNICPSQPVAAIRASREDGSREGVNLGWGLVPFWAKDPKIGYKMINARSETAAEKPAFPRRLQESTLHHPGQWILRVEPP